MAGLSMSYFVLPNFARGCIDKNGTSMFEARDRNQFP
jgi:hypothetical protein